jgi:hypothetical protein
MRNNPENIDLMGTGIHTLGDRSVINAGVRILLGQIDDRSFTLSPCLSATILTFGQVIACKGPGLPGI